MAVIKISAFKINISIVVYKTRFCLQKCSVILYIGIFQKINSCLTAPITQLHGWWHIFAGYSSYMHIIYCLYHRQIFLKQNSKITVQPWIGITIQKDPGIQNGDKRFLHCYKNDTTEHVKNKQSNTVPYSGYISSIQELPV